MKKKIERAKGKLGILIPGLGAAAATFITGVEAVKKGLAIPSRSLIQTGGIRVDKKTGSGYTKLKDYVSFANIKDIVFGGWDVNNENLFQAFTKAKTPAPASTTLQLLKTELETIVPMKAVMDKSALSVLATANIKRADDKFELAKMVMYDIENFSVVNNCTRLVVMCLLPAEKNIEVSEVHQTIEAFEEGLCSNHPGISPSMIYAYAALILGVPFVNGSGNITCDIPALTELSKSSNAPLAGKRFKPAAAFNETSYLFNSKTCDCMNNDVFHSLNNFFEMDIKEAKSGHFLQKFLLGANQKSARNIHAGSDTFAGNHTANITGFLPDHFISQACAVLDVALFIDLAKRAGMRGLQEWLSFYFMNPQAYPGLKAEYDRGKQLANLENALHYLKSKDLIAHLDLDYYE